VAQRDPALLAQYVAAFRSRGLPVLLSRDWHPPDHCSFRERGGPWPVHCVAGSPGALPPADFEAPGEAAVIHEATSPHKDAYSGFEGTSLDQELRALRVRRLFVGGLATDYCVLCTVRDARKLDYEVCLLEDAIRSIDATPGAAAAAVDEMIRMGARPTRLTDLRACCA
jgi:nicotinamidase/pyrazinamidase